MDYLTILKEELVVAMGCTEPACAALCVAAASAQLGDALPVEVRLAVSPYIAKNGMAVGIPGTQGLTGLPIAAAMGAVGKNPVHGLDLLRHVSPEQAKMAHALLPHVRVSARRDAPKVYAEALVTSSAGNTAHCVISGKHDRILCQGFGPPELELAAECRDMPPGNAMSFSGIQSFCAEVPIEALHFLRETVALNMAIAREGLTDRYGLAVGYHMKADMDSGRLGDDDINQVVALTAAAADARMAGSLLSVVSTAGSGNQGLTASVPIIAMAERMGAEEEALLRALALSELATIHAKQHIGRLSVLCGCSIAAAVGVCAGIARLRGGGQEEMALAINSLLADISGVICDGAKPGCSLKIATATASALRAVALAFRGSGASPQDGIVCADIEESLANLGRLGTEGMRETNSVILDMMMDKV